MIEVEIRGKLEKDEFQKLKEFLEKEGDFIGNHEREMILLYDYPGYAFDPNARQTDIRLRKTDTKLEIMVKHKVSDNNVGREEISLGLKSIPGNEIETWKIAKNVLKALGFSKGLWMERKKNIYRLHDIEWSLVDAGGDNFYFEAEQECSDTEDISAIQENLEREAGALGLSVLNPDEMREFILMLDKKVNKQIEW